MKFEELNFQPTIEDINLMLMRNPLAAQQLHSIVLERLLRELCLKLPTLNTDDVLKELALGRTRDSKAN
jgi:hypothetical protein